MMSPINLKMNSWKRKITSDFGYNIIFRVPILLENCQKSPKNPTFKGSQLFDYFYFYMLLLNKYLFGENSIIWLMTKNLRKWYKMPKKWTNLLKFSACEV